MENSTIVYSEKEEAILEVAERLFALNGFDATSVRDIAKEANVNIAMISYYFGSKQNLLTAIIAKHANIIRIKLEALVADEHLTHWEKIENLIDSIIKKYFLQENFHKIVAREQLKKDTGEMHSMLYNMKMNNQLLVRKLISDGQKAGVFKKNIDIPMMMSTLIGTVNHLISIQHFYKEINNQQHLNEDEFQNNIKKKLSKHLKSLFKVILNND